MAGMRKADSHCRKGQTMKGTSYEKSDVKRTKKKKKKSIESLLKGPLPDSLQPLHPANIAQLCSWKF